MPVNFIVEIMFGTKMTYDLVVLLGIISYPYLLDNS